MFDIEYLKAELGIDLETIKELKEVYSTSLESSSVNLYTIINQNPVVVDDIYPLVHTIKGTCSSVGDAELFETCKKICGYIHSDNLTVEVLIPQINHLLNMIDSRLNYLHELIL